jgi:hypothetical protein
MYISYVRTGTVYRGITIVAPLTHVTWHGRRYTNNRANLAWQRDNAFQFCGIQWSVRKEDSDAILQRLFVRRFYFVPVDEAVRGLSNGCLRQVLVYLIDRNSRATHPSHFSRVLAIYKLVHVVVR